MKWSLVIPTYNMADGLVRSLRFAAAQELPAEHDFEIIVINDGSSDHTAQVLEEHTASIPNLRYVYLPRDEGWSCRARARNYGLSMAKGDVISFIDCGVAFGSRFAALTLGRLKDARTVLLHHVLGHAISLVRQAR